MKFVGVLFLWYAVLIVSGQDVNTTTTEDPTTTTTTKETTTTSQPPDTTTSTTAKPTTTPPAPAPPAPSPPAPGPKIPDYPLNKGKWIVEDKAKNVTCVILKGAMQINLTGQNKTVSFNVPGFAEATGSCAEPQSIVLTWNSTVLNVNKTNYLENSLTLSFESNATVGSLSAADSGITSGKYGLENVTVVLHENQNITFNGQLLNKAVFQTPINHSYSCFAEEVLKSDDSSFQLKIREIQLEAYRSTTGGHSEFSVAVPCPADDATDVVPIAVGAALAGLVVIVLIAYLVGRRRSRARGYQSV
ncbi:Lysosome-associated membrane glycoprotein 1 [Orchesella cincta]|uniref:Lysosome-associated membrane glycoprotein 5 n=1 Tax=Orchesella cincta TaxID=48709 RepID=A0A1D2N3S1_ORCCI|nr:Lysosome-associated membrane glycoprotein 1 [Orchesella cincta]